MGGGYHELIEELDIKTAQNFKESITECLSHVTVGSKGLDGDIPQSIIDGENATTWQSYYKAGKSTLVIDLKDEFRISGGILVW